MCIGWLCAHVRRDTGCSAAPPLRPDLLWDTRFADIALRPSKSTKRSTLLALYARAWAANLPFSLSFPLFLFHSLVPSVSFFAPLAFFSTVLPSSFLHPFFPSFFLFFSRSLSLSLLPHISVPTFTFSFVSPFVSSSFCPFPVVSLAFFTPFYTALLPRPCLLFPFPSTTLPSQPPAPASLADVPLLVPPLISASHFCSVHDPLPVHSPLFRRHLSLSFSLSLSYPRPVGAFYLRFTPSLSLFPPSLRLTDPPCPLSPTQV